MALTDTSNQGKGTGRPGEHTDIRQLTDMIWLCDVPSVPPNVTPEFNANTEPADVSTGSGHSACPSNRHNYRTNVMFCGGHAETPKPNDLRNPVKLFWRVLWDNDNDPRTEAGEWQGNPPWINVLEQ